MTIKIRDYKGGPHCEVDIIIRWPDGTPHRERRRSPVTGRSASRRWALQREAELLRGGQAALAPVEPAKEIPTLEVFGPRFIEGYAKANRHKPSGVATKERIFRIHLYPALGRLPLDQITNEEVQKLKASLPGGPKTTNNVLSVLSKTLKIAVEWSVLDQMPCTIKLVKVDMPEMFFYEPEEYAGLVVAAEKVDERAAIVVLLGGDAGLRRGEMIGLEQTDIDYRRRQIHVQRAVWKGTETLPKGGRRRIVPMTEKLAGRLAAARHLRGPRVLYEDDGSPVDESTVQNWMKQATRRAGLAPTRSLHILRHTFCSHLAIHGAAPKAIQELAGHKSLSTTMRYMHLTPAARESAIHLLDKARKGLSDSAGRGDVVEKADHQKTEPNRSK